jgi:hypothetical protein
VTQVVDDRLAPRGFEEGVAAGGFDDAAGAVFETDASEPVGEASRLGEVVGDQHQGVFDLEALDEIFDGLGRFGIEGAGGFRP